MIKNFILNYIQREYALSENIDPDTFNYIKTGYVDSIGLVQFIVTLEEEFNVEITDEELADERYQILGEMIKLIESKASAK